ncbi:MAG: hemerythrin domain-containing protein [Pseudomonadota bacterium]
MSGLESTVDLRGEAPELVQTAAFYAVKEVAAGETIVLLTAQEPGLMMQSLDLQLRHGLSWLIERQGEAQWRVEVRRREETAPQDVFDLLMREHKAIDELFARALHLINAGEVAQAAPLLAEFGRRLRRHVEVENNLLAPRFAAPTATMATGDDPLSIMLREHGEILAQLALIEACFAEGLPQAQETAPFFAILSGTLAKHEYREETLLFPLWQAALARAPEMARAQLLREVGGRLT